MKTDLDSLMEAEGIDVLLVTGPGQHNPGMVYMTGGAHLTRGVLIKKRNEDPFLFHNAMERDGSQDRTADEKYGRLPL